eukprot:5949755-Pleurochrysis_carterae.AAC.1
MPVLHSKLAAGGGAGGNALPIAVRVLAYGQLARLNPPRAVGPNRVAVLQRAAPWHPCTKPSFDTVCKLRSVMIFVSEMLATRQVADLKRVVSFGFDESDQQVQIGMLSTNVPGEAANGRTIDIVMRGAFVIAGGTAEHVVDA